MHAIDLPAYYQRIGYACTSPLPALDRLKALHLAHVTTIPFENLAAWSHKPVSLELPDIEKKLIAGRRGGYCFETNSLFAAVLRQLGFRVTPLIARARWMLPPEVRTGRTHMILQVHVDGRPWLADVGFGRVGLTGPIAMDVSAPQPTPHETRRIVTEKGISTHQILMPGGCWEDVYQFDLQEAYPVDFEIANWFTSTHPASIFRQNLIVTLPCGDHRLVLASRELSRRFSDGRLEKRVVSDDADLRSLLVNDFHLPADDPDVQNATLALSSVDTGRIAFDPAQPFP